MSQDNEYESPDVPNFKPSLSGDTITADDKAQFQALKLTAVQAFDQLEQKQMEAYAAIQAVNQLIDLGQHVLALVEKYAPLLGASSSAPGGSAIGSKITQATSALSGVRSLLTEASPLLAGLGIKLPGLG